MDPGSWTDQGSIGVKSSKGKTYNAIDPNLLIVGDQHYMNFGSFWGDIYQMPLGTSPSKASASATPKQIVYNGAGTHPLEGSYGFVHNGYNYLFWSEGICCGYDKTRPKAGEEYKIKVCRSKSATGGYVSLGMPSRLIEASLMNRYSSIRMASLV
jgi:arabinan endo-1,5-alpha-L-arabinosidase